MIKKMHLAELVEDMDFYPRESVDATHVTQITDAISSGATLPPIIADAKSLRIIDGFHRRRALLRFDDKAVVDVDLRNYKSEAEMILDAIELNSTHGKNLSPNDRTRCIILGERFKIKEKDIARVLNITIQKCEEIRKFKIKKIAKTQESMPVKFGVREFLSGKTLSQEQADKMTLVGGNKLEFYINQIKLFLETYIDAEQIDEDLKKKLNELRDTITNAIG